MRSSSFSSFRIVQISGDSYRLKDKRKAGTKPATSAG
jgi:hypothetical protein